MKRTNNESKFFELDIERLDEELINQPKLYYRYAKKLADAREDLEQAKAVADVVFAETCLQIRREPESFDVEKLTEAVVKEVAQCSEPYQRALQRLTRRRHEVDVLAAAVTALEHRKRALEKLVDLHGQQYFSVPSLRGEEGREMARKAKRKNRRSYERDEE